MKRKPSEIAAIAGLALAALCCVCILLAWTALDALGWVVSAPFRLFQGRQPAERTLRRVLTERESAAFTFGENCDYTYAQGSALRSSPEPGLENGFASDLSRGDVIRLVSESMAGEVFTVKDGSIQLLSGTPVRSSLLAGDEVSIGFDEQSSTDVSTTSRSLDGVVEGNRFTGTFHFSENISEVVNGQGYEEATRLDAGLTCPLLWIETE